VTTVVRREDLARTVADAVLDVPGVAGLTGGPGVEVATLFAGGKVVGLRIGDGAVDVHLVADRIPLHQVAEDAAAAAQRVLSAVGDPRQVNIVIEDVVAGAIDRRSRT
jgi:hypothetical protein